MIRTNTYQFPRMVTGDLYRAEWDAQRFVSLDYNLVRYVGIVGSSVATGWRVGVVAGRTVRVTPGTGVINGMYSETPWVTDQSTGAPVRLSDAIAAGYAVVEEIPGWSSPSGSFEGGFYAQGGNDPADVMVFNGLGPEGEDKNFDGTVDGVLEPTYKEPPAGYLDDPFVKAVDGSWGSLVLADNADSYVYVERTSDDPDKTSVEVGASTSKPRSSNKLVLAKVVVRSGVVTKVDSSDQQRAEGIIGVASRYAKDVVAAHRHGGGSIYDPPKINLMTDSRRCYLLNFSAGSATYKAAGNDKTSTTDGHYHEYQVDAEGNGSTMGFFGGGDSHGHAIRNRAVEEVIAPPGSSVGDHAHILNPEERAWQDGDRVKVFLNGDEVDPSKYSLSAAGRTVRFVPGVVDMSPPTYESTYLMSDGRSVTFSMVTYSLASFILHLMADYVSRSTDADGNAIPGLRNPFVFYTTTSSPRTNLEYVDYGSHDEFYATAPIPVDQVLPQSAKLDAAPGDLESRGLDGLWEQVSMAAAALLRPGDTYVLTPYIGRFVTISLKKGASVNSVRVEILRDVEVSGSLSPSNILFVRAETIASGVLRPEVIPFLSHAGRLAEEFLPTTFATTTGDGVLYSPSASETQSSSGHYHRSFVDGNGNGSTLAVMRAGSIVVWQEGRDGKLYNIEHSHPIKGWEATSRVCKGLNIASQAPEEATHSHSVDIPAFGNAALVYSMCRWGGITYLGTSEGLLVPQGVGNSISAYVFVVGGMSYHDFRTGILTTEGEMTEMLTRAIRRYEDDSGKGVGMTEAEIAAAAQAATAVVVTHVSYLRQGKVPIVVKPVDNSLVDDMYIDSVRTAEEVAYDETILRELTQEESDAYYDIANMSEVDRMVERQSADKIYKVRRRLDAAPATALLDWRGCLTYVSPTHVVLKTGAGWVDVPRPASATRIHAAAQDSDGNMWLASNDGLLVARMQDTAGTAFSRHPSSGPGGSSVSDVVAAADGVLVAWSGGIHMVDADGACTQVATGSFVSLSPVSGDGRVFAVDSERNVVVSSDGGESWSPPKSQIPADMGEIGRASLVGGSMYLATGEGVVKSSTGEEWEVASTQTIHCFFGESFAGGVNAVYDLPSFSARLSIKGGPIPIAHVGGAAAPLSFVFRNGVGGYPLRGVASPESVRFETHRNSWTAPNGAWDAACQQELFINGHVVMSTRDGTDTRSSLAHGCFVSPESGRVDMSFSTTTSTMARAGDSTIVVADSSKLLADDHVVVVPDKAASKASTFTVVSSSNGVVSISPPLAVDAAANSKVVKLVGAEVSSVVANLYDSALADIGTRRHDEVEDAFAVEADGLPMRMADVARANLSQMVLAVKHALPSVDDYLVGWSPYTMSYSRNPLDDNHIGGSSTSCPASATRPGRFRGCPRHPAAWCAVCSSAAGRSTEWSSLRRTRDCSTALRRTPCAPTGFQCRPSSGSP